MIYIYRWIYKMYNGIYIYIYIVIYNISYCTYCNVYIYMTASQAATV